MLDLSSINTNGMLLEAEVKSSGQRKFEDRYFDATGVRIAAGTTPNYQNQPNKWGAELRIYFNDGETADTLRSNGLSVEANRGGYRSIDYAYRVSNSELWWRLVEERGLSLGEN